MDWQTWTSKELSECSFLWLFGASVLVSATSALILYSII
jgi:hypothetical protein